MINVLCVCLGNLSRSQMAAAWLHYKLQGNPNVFIDSAGSLHSIGPVAPEAVTVLKENGLSPLRNDPFHVSYKKDIDWDFVVVLDNGAEKEAKKHLSAKIWMLMPVFDPADAEPDQQLQAHRDVFDEMKFKLEEVINLINND